MDEPWLDVRLPRPVWTAFHRWLEHTRGRNVAADKVLEAVDVRLQRAVVLAEPATDGAAVPDGLEEHQAAADRLAVGVEEDVTAWRPTVAPKAATVEEGRRRMGITDVPPGERPGAHRQPEMMCEACGHHAVLHRTAGCGVLECPCGRYQAPAAGADERLAVTADLEPPDDDLTTVMRRPVTPADLIEAVDHLREVLAGWADQLEQERGTT